MTRNRLEALIVCLQATDEYANAIQDDLSQYEKLAVKRYVKFGNQLTYYLKQQVSENSLEAIDDVKGYFIDCMENCAELFKDIDDKVECGKLISRYEKLEQNSDKS